MTDQRAFGATMTTLADGRVLVVGGRTAVGADEEPRTLAKAELYDPATGSWSAAHDMPEPRYGHIAALLPSGKVLIAGGGSSNCPICPIYALATYDLYDPATDTWSVGTSTMNFARANAASVQIAQGSILVVGGGSGDDPQAFSTSEVFTESSGTWSLLSSIGDPYVGATATLMQDGSVFVLGNAGTSLTPVVQTSDIYNPVTASWSHGPSLDVRPWTVPYGGYTVSLLPSGRLLVVGEDNAVTTSPASLTQFYDPHTKAFVSAPPTLFFHVGHTATSLPDGRVLIVGGIDSKATEAFDPATSQWSDMGNMLGTRADHLAALLRDGSVLVATGQGQDDGTNGPGLGYLFTTERSAPLLKPPTYVAAGDSYSAGEGNYPYIYPSDSASGPYDQCHRSPDGYPELLAHDPAVPGLSNIAFVACSGAVTDDLFNRNPVDNESAQSDSLSDETKVVTITIGGNDVNFAAILMNCIYARGPTGAMLLHYAIDVDVFGYHVAVPSVNRNGPGCSTDTKNTKPVDAAIEALGGKGNGNKIDGRPVHSIVDVIDAIHAKARNATIYVADYPGLFGSVPPVGETNCKVGIAHISTPLGTIDDNLFIAMKDLGWIIRKGSELDNTIMAAVKTEQNRGISVVPVEMRARSAGHGICDRREAWFYPATVYLDSSGNVTSTFSGSFHPTTDGQASYRDGYVAAGIR